MTKKASDGGGVLANLFRGSNRQSQVDDEKSGGGITNYFAKLKGSKAAVAKKPEAPPAAVPKDKEDNEHFAKRRAEVRKLKKELGLLDSKADVLDGEDVEITEADKNAHEN
jgi:hypothetical protein